jgi:hypothetical protein
MAARFWVTGGTGNWNSTTNWSTTSGGASGASVPSTSDTATFNASSGAGTATLDISPTVQTLTCTGFTGTLAFGTNTISLNSTGTVFTGATTMTVTGTPQIILTDSSASGRTLDPTTVTEANSISFRITAGTGTISLGTAGVYRNLDFTDGTNPTGYAGALGGGSITVYGNFKASTGMTQTAVANTITFAATSGTKTITTAGVTFDRPFTFNGVGGTWQLQDALTIGSTRTLTLTSGTLDLSSYTLTTGIFSSSNSNIRTLAFGTGNITLTGVATTIFSTSTVTNMTITGTAVVNCVATTGTSVQTRTFIAGAHGEAQAITVNINSGTSAVDIFRLATTSGAFKDVTFSSTFTGTIQIGNAIIVYGNFDVGGTTAYFLSSSATLLTFGATSGTQNINFRSSSYGTSAVTSGIIFGSASSTATTFVLTNGFTALPTATIPITLTAGTLSLKAGVTSTVSSFTTTGTTQKFLQSTISGTQATISDASGTVDATYLTIQDINATGGATFNAYLYNSNIDAGNNTGWNGLSISDFAIGNVGNVTYSLTINITGVNSTGAIGTVQSGNIAVVNGQALVVANGNPIFAGIGVIDANAIVISNGRIMGDEWTDQPIGTETWSPN